MKKVTKITLPVAAVAMIAVPLPLATPAFAENASTVPATIPANATTALDRQVQAIITYGDQLINQQINALTRLKTQVANDHVLSDANQSTFTTQLDNQIAILNTLKTKLDAETDPAAARADVATIINNNEVVFNAQKISLVRSIDAQQTDIASLTTMLSTLQNQVTTAKNNGRNMTQLQAWLDDATAKLQAATNQLATTEASVLALQSSDSNARSTLNDYQNQLSVARADYAQAQAKAQAVRASLFWAAWWFL